MRVLDLTRVLAGPWCTQMLADLGADVIKVERLVLGRRYPPLGPPWIENDDGERVGDSAYFTSANRNKRSIAIDIATPQGQALVRELALQCDVLVENSRWATWRATACPTPTWRELNPRLVYCSITGYGQDGPFMHTRPATTSSSWARAVDGITGERRQAGRRADEIGHRGGRR